LSAVATNKGGMSQLLSMMPAPTRVVQVFDAPVGPAPGPKSCVREPPTYSLLQGHQDRGSALHTVCPTTVQMFRHVVPPYLKRKGYVPRRPEDFGDGGAFPEIHVSQ